MRRARRLTADLLKQIEEKAKKGFTNQQIGYALLVSPQLVASALWQKDRGKCQCGKRGGHVGRCWATPVKGKVPVPPAVKVEPPTEAVPVAVPQPVSQLPGKPGQKGPFSMTAMRGEDPNVERAVTARSVASKGSLTPQRGDH